MMVQRYRARQTPLTQEEIDWFVKRGQELRSRYVGVMARRLFRRLRRRVGKLWKSPGKGRPGIAGSPRAPGSAQPASR